MTNSQWKKQRARLFNLRRDEEMAHKMDAELFPKPKQVKSGRIVINDVGRMSKADLELAIATNGIAPGWNSP